MGRDDRRRLAGAVTELLPVQVHGAEMRIAETRAVNRALRKAYGIGICSVEELGSNPSSFEPKKQADPAFFSLVRDHTLQGTFGDPYYGGNAGFVGWDLIGYPGVRLSVGQAQQAMDPHLSKVRMSAYDFSMFDRSGARVAEQKPAPVDHAHMASGMGDPEHDR